jgi:hypothetical protein
MVSRVCPLRLGVLILGSLMLAIGLGPLPAGAQDQAAPDLKKHSDREYEHVPTKSKVRVPDDWELVPPQAVGEVSFLGLRRSELNIDMLVTWYPIGILPKDQLKEWEDKIFEYERSLLSDRYERYKLTEETMAKLKQDNVPDEVLNNLLAIRTPDGKMRSSMLDRSFSRGGFKDELLGRLRPDQIAQFETKLLNQTRLDNVVVLNEAITIDGRPPRQLRIIDDAPTAKNQDRSGHVYLFLAGPDAKMHYWKVKIRAIFPNDATNRKKMVETIDKALNQAIKW